jgi:membrane fusion protein (multidrug efflux system)
MMRKLKKNMNPIIPRVSGYVDKVYIKDNDFVKKGDSFYNRQKRLPKLKKQMLQWLAEGNFEVSRYW